MSLGDDDLAFCMDADTVIHLELFENAECAGISTRNTCPHWISHPTLYRNGA